MNSLAPESGQEPSRQSTPVVVELPAERLANATTHGVGAGMAIAALVWMIVAAAGRADPRRVVSFALYGSSLVLLYLASTFYHSVPEGTTKRLLRRFDHAAIFLLIGGTYTPLQLVSLRGAIGWTLAGIVWGLMIIGILMKPVWFSRCRRLRIGMYVAMGWTALAILHVLYQ